MVKKKRIPIPNPTKRDILIEAGYLCSVPKCHAEASLEFHHIDGNPANNNQENILLLCANHHSQATKGKIDRLACKKMKAKLINNPQTVINHEKLAQLIAENLVAEDAWPKAIDVSSTLNEAAGQIYTQLGINVELLLRHESTLTVWLRAQPLPFHKMKALCFASACICSELNKIGNIEVGFSKTRDYVNSTGGGRIADIRFQMPALETSKIAGNVGVPYEFWGLCKIVVVTNEGLPHCATIRTPLLEFESRL